MTFLFSAFTTCDYQLIKEKSLFTPRMPKIKETVHDKIHLFLFQLKRVLYLVNGFLCPKANYMNKNILI